MFGWVEDFFYVAVAVALGAAGAILFGYVIYDFVSHFGEQSVEANILKLLDGLLLVFILLELLAGVRATMTERQLVAEPFLIVGIIAAIKEILVITLEAKETRGEGGRAFRDAMLEVGILGGVVVLLALASFLVRRKEREPEEAD